jgi:hypothetical protein
MSDLREALDRRAKAVQADSDALPRVLRRAERRHRHRRISAALVALSIAGAGSAFVYLGMAGRVQAPSTTGSSPSPFGEKTVTVDGVPFTISGASSSDGPCIGVSVLAGSIGGGCGRSSGRFQWGEGGLRANGRLYNIAYGEAPPGAFRMKVVLRDGSTMTSDTTEGLWLFVLRANDGDFATVKAEDETGTFLAQVDLPPLAAERRAAKAGDEAEN